jgi:hypothetical protein
MSRVIPSASRRASLAGVVLALLAGGQSLAQTPPPAAAPLAAYDATVRERIRPGVERLLDQLAREGRDMELDGVPVFNGSDKFLPGKIALGLTDSMDGLAPDDPKAVRRLADFRKIARLTVDDPNDSWGIYYYLSALSALQARGKLAEAVDPLTLAKLKVRLDWRTFVDTATFTLIDHPNNYYCVAFAIARLRHQLGWEDAAGSEQLLAAMLQHYRAYSGPYGFADETDGEGRFDRYSVLLAGEIAQRFLETGGEPPAEVKGWLRKSADVMLMRLNAEGRGFEYGRSLGPYGETSMIEVLTAAANLGLLTPAEKELAYAYSARAAQRYAEVWLDPGTGSVNLWDEGRRTDAYRGKFRILGENLSLAHQYVYTAAAWRRLGYGDKAPSAGWVRGMDRLPTRAVTWFAKGEHDRVLVTLRDRGRVIGLPLISGGAGQHMNSPYAPIPFSPGMLEGVADAVLPLLVPHITLADGTVLAPLAYIGDVRITEGVRKTGVAYRMTAMDRLGQRQPAADARLTAETRYEFTPGRITRIDTYRPAGPLAVSGIALQFAAFNAAPARAGQTFRYAGPGVRTFAATGFDRCDAQPTNGDPAFRAPDRAMQSVVTCRLGARVLSAPLELRWTLTYD